MGTKTRFAAGLLAAAWLANAGCQGQINGQPAGGAGNTGTAGASSPGTGGTSSPGTGGTSSPGTAGAVGTGGVVGTAGTLGTGGSGTTACTPLPAIQRRLWRLSAEQYGSAVKDLLGLAAAPILTNRGGEAPYAFFSDVSMPFTLPVTTAGSLLDSGSRQ